MLYNTPTTYTNTATTLGVTYDRGMSFKQHAANFNTMTKIRLNVFRALTIYHLRSAPARRQRAGPPHNTVAMVDQTELDTLPPIPENTSL